MEDQIVEIDELIRDRARTKKELLETLDIDKAKLDKKIEALWQLGKVELLDSSWGQRIVHKSFSSSQAEIEEEIPKSWRSD